jgi:REP element-mobilizing transposase RayT
MKNSHTFSQQKLFENKHFTSGTEFGGALLGKGHAKRARPLSTKQAMHVVMRSSLAKGAWSLRTSRNLKAIERSLKKISGRFGIKVYRYAIVGNHIHLLIKLSNRFTFAPFIRAFTGMVAMLVTGSSKIKMLTEKFWDAVPWSRIVEWGKAYGVVKAYVFQNEMEACGAVPYSERKKSSERKGNSGQKRTGFPPRTSSC